MTPLSYLEAEMSLVSELAEINQKGKNDDIR